MFRVAPPDVGSPGAYSSAHQDSSAEAGHARDVADLGLLAGTLRDVHVVAPEHLAQDRDALHQGEARTDAPADTAPERDPGVRGDLPLEEALGAEPGRVGEVVLAGMTDQDR